MVLYMRLLMQTVSGALKTLVSLTPNDREMQSMTKNILI